MIGWVERSVHRPWPALVVCALLVVAALTALPHLRLETGGRELFPPAHPALQQQQAIDADFGSSEWIVVALEVTSGDVFTQAVLQTTRELSAAIESLPGVDAERVQSLSTVVAVQVTDRGLDVTPPLLFEIESPADAAAVRARIGETSLLRGTLVASDGRGVAIYAPLRPEADPALLTDAVRLAAQAHLTAAGLGLEQGIRLHVLGSAPTQALLGDHISADNGRWWDIPWHR